MRPRRITNLFLNAVVPMVLLGMLSTGYAGESSPPAEFRDTSSPARAVLGLWKLIPLDPDRGESLVFYGENGIAVETRLESGKVIEYAYEIFSSDPEVPDRVTIRMDDDPADGVEPRLEAEFTPDYEWLIGNIIFRAADFSGRLKIMLSKDHTLGEDGNTAGIPVMMRYLGSGPDPEWEPGSNLVDDGPVPDE